MTAVTALLRGQTVTAMSVYRYVDTKDELLELALDAAFGELYVPGVADVTDGPVPGRLLPAGHELGGRNPGTTEAIEETRDIVPARGGTTVVEILDRAFTFTFTFALDLLPIGPTAPAAPESPPSPPGPTVPV